SVILYLYILLYFTLSFSCLLCTFSFSLTPFPSLLLISFFSLVPSLPISFLSLHPFPCHAHSPTHTHTNTAPHSPPHNTPTTPTHTPPHTQTHTHPPAHTRYPGHLTRTAVGKLQGYFSPFF